MSYPYSINRTIIIKKSELGDNSKQSIDYFMNELQAINCDIIKESTNKIIIKKCFEFSSQSSTFKNLNRGKILFESTNDTITIKSKLIVFEHLLSFLLLMILFVIGIINFKESSAILGVSAIALLASFAFFYLIPLMTFHSFIKGTIDKIITNRNNI